MTQEVMGAIDTRELRHAFGTFATGVTVVTCRSDDGVPHGATVNAFTAVSLDPPLAQVTLTRTSRAARYLEGAAVRHQHPVPRTDGCGPAFRRQGPRRGAGMDPGRQCPGADPECSHARMPAVERLRRRRPHHRRRARSSAWKSPSGNRSCSSAASSARSAGSSRGPLGTTPATPPNRAGSPAPAPSSRFTAPRTNPRHTKHA